MAKHIRTMHLLLLAQLIHYASTCFPLDELELYNNCNHVINVAEDLVFDLELAGLWSVRLGQYFQGIYDTDTSKRMFMDNNRYIYNPSRRIDCRHAIWGCKVVQQQYSDRDFYYCSNERDWPFSEYNAFHTLIPFWVLLGEQNECACLVMCEDKGNLLRYFHQTAYTLNIVNHNQEANGILQGSQTTPFVFNIVVKAEYLRITQEKTIKVTVCGNEIIVALPVEYFVHFMSDPDLQIPHSTYDNFFKVSGGDHPNCYWGREYQLFNDSTCNLPANVTKVHYGIDLHTLTDYETITVINEKNSTLFQPVWVKKITRGLKTACAEFQEMTCDNIIRPKFNLFPFYIQKNRGVIELLTIKQMNTLYELQEELNGYCGVTEWFVTPFDSDGIITAANEPLYSKIVYGSADKRGSFLVDTSLSHFGQTVDFGKLWMMFGARGQEKLNNNKASFKILVGCYHDTFIQAQQTASPSELVSFSSAKLSLVFAKTPTDIQQQILMSSYIEFVTDTAKCSFQRITQFNHSNYITKILASDQTSVRFTANPLERRLTDGQVDETILFPNGPTAFNKKITMYLNVDTFGVEYRDFVSTKYEIEVNICDDQPQLLVPAQISINTLAKGQASDVAYLLNTFQYQVQFPQCKDYEYIFSTSKKLSGATTIPGLWISDNVLHVDTSSSKTLNFFIIMRGIQSLNTVAYEFMVKVIDCSEHLVTPFVPTLSFFKQKFSSDQQIMSIDQIKNAFTPETETYCELSEWSLLNPSNVEITRLMQDQRLTKFDPLLALLTYDNCLVQPGDHLMEVKLKLFQGTGKFRTSNPNLLILKINIGCFTDSVVKTNLKKDHGIQNIEYFENNFLKLQFARTSIPTEQKIKMSDFFEFSTVIPCCGPYFVTAFNDLGLSNKVTTNDPLKLNLNPTVRNAVSGIFQPEIWLTSSPFSRRLETIYLVLQTKTTSGPGSIKTVMTVQAELCSVYPSLNKESKYTFEKPWKEWPVVFKLSDLFNFPSASAFCGEYTVQTFQNTSTNELVEIKHANIHLENGTLELRPEEVGFLKFNLVLNYTRSMSAAVIEFSLNVRTCTSEDLKPSTSLVSFKIEVGEDPVVLMTDSEIINSFKKPIQTDLCSVQEWYLSGPRDNRQILSGPLFERFLLVTKKMPIDKLSLMPTLEAGTQETFEVRINLILGYGGYRALNPSSLGIKVVVYMALQPYFFPDVQRFFSFSIHPDPEEQNKALLFNYTSPLAFQAEGVPNPVTMQFQTPYFVCQCVDIYMMSNSTRFQMMIKSWKLRVDDIRTISIKVVLIQGELRSVHDLWMQFTLNRTEVVRNKTIVALSPVVDQTNKTEIIAKQINEVINDNGLKLDQSNQDQLLLAIAEFGVNELANMPPEVYIARMNVNLSTAEDMLNIVRLLKVRIESEDRLKRAGFYFEPEVQKYFFPNSNIDEIKPSQMLNQSERLKMKQPQMSFRYVSFFGEILIDFDQDMVHPKVINQTLYNNVFNITVKSGINHKLYHGKFEDKNHKILSRRLQLDYEQQNLEFNLTVINHTARLIAIKMNFWHETNVSIGRDRDQVEVHVLEPLMFRSVTSLKPIYVAESDRIKYTQELLIPRLILNKQLEEGVTSLTSTQTKLGLAIFPSNIVAKFVMGGSMQQIWTAVRAAQTITFEGLTLTPLPSHMDLFLQGCMQFAQMDIFDGGQFYHTYFGMNETVPFNVYFVVMGIDTQNFLVNSGSYFVFVLCLLVLNLLNRLMVRIALKYYTVESLRRIGIKLDAKLRSSSLKAQQTRLYIEYYNDLCLAFVLNLHFFINYSIPFVGSDCVNTILVFIFAAAGVLSPIVFYKLIKTSISRPEDDLEHKRVITETLVADTKDEPLARYFNLIFLLRHSMMVLNIILFNGHGEIQGLIFVVLDFANLIYVIIVQPFDRKSMNRLQILNELAIYTCCVIMLQFNNPMLGHDVGYFLGWAYIIVVSTNIFSNIGYSAYNTIVQLAKFVQEFKRRIKNKTTSSEKADLDFRQAYFYCQDWQKQRRWLHKHGLPFYKMKEEARYLKYQKKYHVQDFLLGYLKHLKKKYEEAQVESLQQIAEPQQENNAATMRLKFLGNKRKMRKLEPSNVPAENNNGIEMREIYCVDQKDQLQQISNGKEQSPDPFSQDQHQDLAKNDLFSFRNQPHHTSKLINTENIPDSSKAAFEMFENIKFKSALDGPLIEKVTSFALPPSLNYIGLDEEENQGKFETLSFGKKIEEESKIEREKVEELDQMGALEAVVGLILELNEVKQYLFDQKYYSPQSASPKNICELLTEIVKQDISHRHYLFEKLKKLLQLEMLLLSPPPQILVGLIDKIDCESENESISALMSTEIESQHLCTLQNRMIIKHNSGFILVEPAEHLWQVVANYFDSEENNDNVFGCQCQGIIPHHRKIVNISNYVVFAINQKPQATQMMLEPQLELSKYLSTQLTHQECNLELIGFINQKDKSLPTYETIVQKSPGSWVELSTNSTMDDHKLLSRSWDPSVLVFKRVESQ